MIGEAQAFIRGGGGLSLPTCGRGRQFGLDAGDVRIEILQPEL
jgi:hypothetical protein